MSSLRLRNFPKNIKDTFPWHLPLIQKLDEVYYTATTEHYQRTKLVLDHPQGVYDRI